LVISPGCLQGGLLEEFCGHARNRENHFNLRFQITALEWNHPRQGCHFHRAWEYRRQPKLQGKESDIFTAPLEINVFACERSPSGQPWFFSGVKFSPIIDRLAPNQKRWRAFFISDFEDLGEMPQGKPHRVGVVHFAIAAKDCSRLTIFHFVAPPTKEACFCSRPAKRGLRPACTIAEMRRRASRCFKSMTFLVFTLPLN